MTKGDGIRIFVRYTNKFEVAAGRDIGIYNKDAFVCQDGVKIKILDADTITLLKYLRRKGLSLRIPITSLIDFNDMIYNFPTLCCRSELVVDTVIEAIKELCQAWESNGDDRLIAFGIMINLENESAHVSFAGHVSDFVQLFNSIQKVVDISFEEWIDNIHQKNNLFKSGDDYPNKFKLIHGDVVCFHRLIVSPSKIHKIWWEDGALKGQLNLSKDEAEYLREHKIIMAPFYRIKEDVCKKCGGDYSKCNCVKFIDKDVSDEVTKADMSGMTWTNRNAYFHNEQIEFVSEKLSGKK